MRPSFYPAWRLTGWRLKIYFLRLILICVLRQLLAIWPIRLSHGSTYPREITEVAVRAEKGLLRLPAILCPRLPEQLKAIAIGVHCFHLGDRILLRPWG